MMSVGGDPQPTSDLWKLLQHQHPRDGRPWLQLRPDDVDVLRPNQTEFVLRSPI